MKAFLAAPFAGAMNGKRLNKHFEHTLRSALRELRAAGYEVHSAHEDEEWGEEWMEAKDCTPRDFDLVKQSDLVVAILNSSVSGGVHIELGWASAAGKPMIVFALVKPKYQFLQKTTI